MTHHWRDTHDGAELVVDGAVRARVYRAGGWGCRFGWSAADTHGIERRVTDSDTKQAAQRAAERALGLAGQDVPRSGHRFDMPTVTESPEFPPPNDSESPKGSPWSCSCGASGVAPDPGPESCPKCGAGEDGDATNPSHYQQHPAGIECIAVTEAFDFNVGNAIKYLWRAGLKGDRVTDLRKALWYIEREIERCARA